MNSFIKSDIFFFIASIGVVIVIILLIILAYYFIRLFKNVKDISKMAKTEASLIAKDIETYRKDIKQEEKKLKNTIDTVSKVIHK